MRVFNKKLNRLLAIMLASVMGATSLPATPVSAGTPSSEYDISNDAASDDISDSKFQMNRIRIIMPPRKNSHSS